MSRWQRWMRQNSFVRKGGGKEEGGVMEEK